MIKPAALPMPRASSPTEHHVIDLFAGVGGLSLGACRAGYNLRLAVEKDPHALLAHKTNFPFSAHSNRDISELSGSALLGTARLSPGELHGIIGGPPCQGFSNIGHRKPDDTRNLLFLKFFDLVREVRPRFFLAENVPGIMSDIYEPIRSQAMELVRDYQLLPPIKVCAADYGAPTTRTRVFFIGYLPDYFDKIEAADFAPPLFIKPVTVKQALVGLPITIKDTWDVDSLGWRKLRSIPADAYGELIIGRKPKNVGDAFTVSQFEKSKLTSGCIATHHEIASIRRFDKLCPGETDPISRSMRLDLNAFCPTLRAGTDSERGSYQAVRPIHPTQPRVITPREGARMQGFPDWFRFAPTKWHSFRQIGNSVSPIVSEFMLSTIAKKDKLSKRLA